MVNTQLLDEKIEASGLKNSFIYEKLGISKTAYCKKKNNKTPFRLSEIYVICDLVKIPDEEKSSIFFA